MTAGNHGLDFRHEEPILSGDPAAMADRFARWGAAVTQVDALPAMLRRAIRTALTPPDRRSSRSPSTCFSRRPTRAPNGSAESRRREAATPTRERARDATGTDALALVGCSTNTTVTLTTSRS